MLIIYNLAISPLDVMSSVSVYYCLCMYDTMLVFDMTLYVCECIHAV